MRTIKNLLAAVAAVALLALSAPRAAAQQYLSSPVAGLAAGTNNIPATTTSNYNATIGLTKYGDAALTINFKLTGSGTENVITTVDQSVDGTNWETKAPFLWTNAANGTTLVSVTTNMNVGAVGYLRLKSINNGSAQAVTNLQFLVTVKPKRNG